MYTIGPGVASRCGPVLDTLWVVAPVIDSLFEIQVAG
jgi:hypothetical protein